MDQKFYAASQVIDEARHIEVFAKFLTEKVGTIYPIGGGLKTLLEILLKAEGVRKKVLGMQTLFEGMAVGIMDMMRDESRNPLMTTTLPNFAELNSPIYMHTVVPNLRNLGLITDRTEDQWRRVGMICDA